MANGDKAAAAGMDVVPGTADLRQGYDEDNKTRDYLADHITAGSHPASVITSGELDVDRLPSIPYSKITGAPASSAADGPTLAAYNRGATGSSWYAVWMNSALQFMRNTSSRRFKKRIRDWTGSALALRTVIFDRRGNDTPVDEVGFIAEEVLEVLPEAVVYFDGQIDGINDRVILAALVADVQRLAAELDELKKGQTNG